MNPANTYWQKPYNVYSKIDSEARALPRFRDLVGIARPAQCRRDAVDRRQSVRRQQADRGEIVPRPRASASTCATSRRPSSCSARGATTSRRRSRRWAGSLDLYDDGRTISVSAGQTIVYTVHQTIGHLGIFVSGKVATKEHSEFASCIDLIDMLPPGLYEAVITEVEEDTARRDLIDGRYLLSLEPRTLDGYPGVWAQQSARTRYGSRRWPGCRRSTRASTRRLRPRS